MSETTLNYPTTGDSGRYKPRHGVDGLRKAFQIFKKWMDHTN